MTLPIATTTIETSFSVMKYIKDELRNRMGYQWTNNCLVVYIEQDVACNICKVVIYNYVLCWLYSMTKSVVIALILFIVFCGILLYWI